ncbi:MAG: hypothetical protein Q9225_003871 [Loekoesia sp. 1 TL-2023]
MDPLAEGILAHTAPLSSGAYPEKILTTDIRTQTLPRSKEQTTPTDTHLTRVNTLEAPYNVAGFKKYIFPVRDSDLVLTIDLGKRVDKVHLASFLEVAKDHVGTQIARFGPEAVLPLGIFEWDLGEDLEIFAESSLTLLRPMTWSILRDAIRGLQEFLIGLKNYREAACRVHLGDPIGLFIGYIDLKARVRIPKTKVTRDVPTLPLGNNTKPSTGTFQINENVQMDLRPQRQRLDIRAVRNVLVVAQDWAEDNIERAYPGQTIDHGEFERTLGEGVELAMVRAPGKRLTYGLVLEALKRLLAWEMDVSKWGTMPFGKAVEFGVLEQGTLKAVGSIKKDRIKSTDVAR